VHNADSPSVFDDLDAALQRGPSEKCIAMQLAADCEWETVGAIPAAKRPPESASKARYDGLKIDFTRLSKLNVPRLFRFWQARKLSKYRECPGPFFDSLRDWIA
jgi:hypothetical protein